MSHINAMGDKVKEILLRGGLCVVPTDTLYGLVASAYNRDAVERVYEVKRRDTRKACIVLIRSIKDLATFDIDVSERILERLDSWWPGAVSVILPVSDEKWRYLTRGTGSLAFRIPNNAELLDLVSRTGPLIAPSANPEGKSPARTVEETRHYFGGSVDHYVDGGACEGQPSTLVEIRDNETHVLRQGVVDI